MNSALLGHFLLSSLNSSKVEIAELPSALSESRVIVTFLESKKVELDVCFYRSHVTFRSTGDALD